MTSHAPYASGQTASEHVRDTVGEAIHGARDAVGEARDAVGEVARMVKPRLRGWIHAGMAPLVLAAGIVLVVLTPPLAPRVGAAVFALSAVLLFSTSAVYHRGTWSPPVARALRRADHTNIFLIIAGTYTPLAIILLERSAATTLLVIVWSGALGGLLMRIFWLGAPRWLYVPVYVALGWVAVAYMPQLWAAGGPAVVWLIIAGGLAYTAGAVVYALKRPDPNPRWFGFHEIFHVATVAGFACHYVAVSIAAYSLR